MKTQWPFRDKEYDFYKKLKMYAIKIKPLSRFLFVEYALLFYVRPEKSEAVHNRVMI